MNKTIRVAFDIPVELMAPLQDFLVKASRRPNDTGTGTVVHEEVSQAQEAPKKTEKQQKKITKTDIRALGVELTKAGKQDVLAAALDKFGAKKLSEIKEEDYEALYAELGGKNE